MVKLTRRQKQLAQMTQNAIETIAKMAIASGDREAANELATYAYVQIRDKIENAFKNSVH